MSYFINAANFVLCVLTVLLKDTNASNWNIADSAVHQSLEIARRQAGIARQDVPPNDLCRDNKAYEPFCKTYRQSDFCNLYPYGMQKHCALTCGFCKCKAKIDIGFLVDSSGSIEKAGKGNYKKCLDFIKNAVNGSFISEQFTHIGLVLFASKRKTVFNLQQFYDSEKMMKAIDKAPYLKGGTLTGKALAYAKTELFDKTGRKDVPSVLIVLTDGRSTDKVTVPATELHNANITVFAIGIGRNYDMGQLTEIASKPDVKYALTADFNRLNDLYTSIRDDACRVNSTLSDLPHFSAGDHQAAFGPHSSHVNTPQMTILKSKSWIEENPQRRDDRILE